MKINLMKFVNDNKEIEELRQEANYKEELNKLIASIIRGETYFYTDNCDLLDDIGVGYKKRESYISAYTIGFSYKNIGTYQTKLTKGNIEKVQKYIDNWEEV